MKNAMLYLLIGLMSCFTQQWVNISPFAESNIGIYGSFISANEGWIKQLSSGVEQAIYHTNDGGKSWEKIFTSSHQLGYFTMVDQNNGWLRLLTGDDPLYTRTTDGGYTWNDMSEYMPIDVDAYSRFYFINKDIGFVSTDIDSIDYSAIIYKTVDGGFNWYLTDTHPLIYYGDYWPYGVEQFFFIDESYGWAGCMAGWDTGSTIYTTDGGENWYPGLGPEHNYISGIHFSSPNKGGAVTYFPTGNSVEVMITNDNFETMEYYYRESVWNQQFPKAICFQNDSTVWVTGEPGIIYKSNDGGATFDSLQTIDANLNKIQFFGNVGYISGINKNALYKFDGESGIEQELRINDCVLFQNYPNPFNPVTEIKFSIEQTQNVNLSIFNSKGELIQTLIDGKKNKGMHTIDFNASQFNSGIYFYKLTTDEKTETRKMLLLK